MQPAAGRFCSVPGAKCRLAGWSSICSARNASRRRTIRARREIEDRHREPERVVRRGEPRQVLEPADERLRVAHADAHVDAPDWRSRASRVPACGKRATLVVGRRVHAGVAGV